MEIASTTVTVANVGEPRIALAEANKDCPEFANSVGAALVHRATIIREAAKSLSIFELDPLSRLSKFHSNIVKEHLSERLRNLLRSYLIRGDFVRLMRKHHIVISGSAVFEFMDPSTAVSWAKLGTPAKDMDIYVRKGSLVPVVEYISRQRGVRAQVIFSSSDAFRVPNRADPKDVVEEYSTGGIRSVVKVKLTRGAEVKYIDIIESTCGSPIYPILHFDLSFCRNALTADGLAVYHADWTFKNISYLCPSIGDPPTSDALHQMRTKVLTRMEKYTKRGVVICHEIGRSPHLATHACTTATSCPHTLRNTEDAGVYFLPFHDMDAEEKKRCKSAHCITLMWRCGGSACTANGTSEDTNACVFRAPNLHKKFVAGRRI